ncbi:hypothetical protein IU436_27350 [Nocardia farcinica]|uniref:hypothetical protein n=1 Tax=Nocardia TaxID=1817 RepID=UPI0018952508|nr:MULTISPECIES: hypothetical protein [Nocardia]MBF6215672.1 hypothetical protein [Nocardia puris]MBF6422357.1 hypothetical protein [Nocardia farcinica]MBF6434058.1 hypothetical protein [Nocardia farcinica]MBF6505114.1 hypothetical protein [Nocardia farcinica]
MTLLATALELHAATAITHSGDVLAQTEVSTGGLRQWINDNVFIVIIFLIACTIGLAANKGNVSSVVTKGGLSLVAIAFIVLAGSNDAVQGVGRWALSLFGINA